jgi:hypothetical protein
MTEITRKTKAFLALYDLGSRDGATARKVKAQMLEEGFTLQEIAEAVKAMNEAQQ